MLIEQGRECKKLSESLSALLYCEVLSSFEDGRSESKQDGVMPTTADNRAATGASGANGRVSADRELVSSVSLLKVVDGWRDKDSSCGD